MNLEKAKSPEISSPIKAVIFDFDGLLVDSEDLWYQAYKTTCAKYGGDYTEELRAETIGQGGISIILMELFNIQEDRQIFRQKVRDTFKTLTTNGLKLMPGAREIVRQLKQDFPLAIGSSSHTEHIRSTINSLGLSDAFVSIVGGDQVERSKPFPDIYLKAAADIGVEPKSCLVFEDSLNGVRAAKSAGMRIVAIPSNPTSSEFTEANWIFNNLNSVDLNRVLK